jgi:tripartite-type tricarboxylate transporter receptor subunit TctC
MGGATNAQSPEEFYRGKQMKIIVGSVAGDAYDNWARLIGRYMTKHLPGNPRIIAQNMPAAGGLAAANHLYHVAEKDGTTIGILSRNIPYQALVQQEGVRFDPKNFNWIGSPELTSRICIAMAGAPVQKAEDLFQRKLRVGGAGAGLALSTTPKLLSRLLGMQFELIEGYAGNPNVILAMEQGEVEGICQTIAGLKALRPNWIEEGKVKVLFNTERTPAPGLDAPSVFSFAKTDEQRRLLSLFSSSVEFGRPLVAPPGVPAQHVAALRAAFDAAMADPDLKAEAERQGLEISVTRGQELTDLVTDLMSTPRELISQLDAMVK